MATFWLMRHGETAYELAEERRLRGGARDWVPLTARGVEQAEALAERVRPLGLSLLLSSPTTRALQTAAVVSRRLDLPVVVEYDLHEWLPDLTGRYDTVAVVLAAAAETEACGGKWPVGEERGWEPASAVRRRAAGVLARYRAHGRVGVVCHGGVIKYLTGRSVGHCGLCAYVPADEE